MTLPRKEYGVRWWEGDVGRTERVLLFEDEGERQGFINDIERWRERMQREQDWTPRAPERVSRIIPDWTVEE